MSSDPRSGLRPPEIIFELLYDAESSLVNAAAAAERYLLDDTTARELSEIAAAIAAVRSRYNSAASPAVAEEGNEHAQGFA